MFHAQRHLRQICKIIFYPYCMPNGIFWIIRNSYFYTTFPTVAGSRKTNRIAMKYWEKITNMALPQIPSGM
jgi:hypothetical protein